VGCKKDDISIKTVAFQNFPQGININRNTHDKKINSDTQGDDYIAFSSPPAPSPCWRGGEAKEIEDINR
jgi:hypothetical protein